VCPGWALHNFVECCSNPAAATDTSTQGFGFTSLKYTVSQVEAASKPPAPPGIYYHRELLIRSPEGRRVELITISSTDGLQDAREPWIPGLFPERVESPASVRPCTFTGKSGIFVSARVVRGVLVRVLSSR
jgi:hypothetical protein